MIADLIDKLLDRIIQLIGFRKQMRKTLLDEFINPIFEEFEKVHKAYLYSFASYRESLKTISQLDQNSPILDQIQSDNLFSADQRAKVFELAKAAEDELIGNFIQSIYRYLVDARLVNPLSQELNPDLIKTQLWRQSLIRELGGIFMGDWRSMIDSDTSHPPFDEDEANLEIDKMFNEYNINSTDPSKNEKLKRALALRALDGIVYDMQSGYQEVTAEYNKIKKTLS